jgi:hypothetical protein
VLPLVALPAAMGLRGHLLPSLASFTFSRGASGGMGLGVDISIDNVASGRSLGSFDMRGGLVSGGKVVHPSSD